MAVVCGDAVEANRMTCVAATNSRRGQRVNSAEQYLLLLNGKNLLCVLVKYFLVVLNMFSSRKNRAKANAEVATLAIVEIDLRVVVDSKHSVESIRVPTGNTVWLPAGSRHKL